MHVASGECIITANFVGLSSYTSWYTLYLAAVAIDARCVRRGLTGVMYRLGESCQMTRSYENGSALKLVPGSEASLLVTIGSRNTQTNMAATS